MKRNILLKTRGEEKNNIRFVVTENGEPVFQGLFKSDTVQNGDIFSVRVKDRLVSCNAVFCDAGLDKPAFISACNLAPGKILLVQAESAEHDKKGVRFSTNIRFTGKYTVLILKQYSDKLDFNVSLSRKISDSETKKRLYDYISHYPSRHSPDVDFTCEVIVRTSAAEITDLSLIDDEINDLFQKWYNLLRLFRNSYLNDGRTGAIQGFHDILDYIVMHEHTADFSEIITDSPVLSHMLCENHPDMSAKIKSMPMSNSYDIFAVYSVDAKLQQLLRHHVYLKSGAYIVIDYTEAMTVIDVNSGKNTVDNSLKINLEAAAEILRQLRLRDIGGIIICDFINMDSKVSEEKLVGYLKDKSLIDSASVYIAGMTKLGLVELTRKRR